MSECTYEVLNVRHTTIASPAGGFVGAQEVTFTTPGSSAQRVTIPDAQFSPETVKAEIEKRCNAIAAIIAGQS